MNDKNMKISVFEANDVSELAKVMVENVKNETCSDAILFYDEAAKLIKELLKYDEVNIEDGCGISVESPEYDGYVGEFIVSLADDYVLGCEKACREKGYISGFQDFVFIDVDSEYPAELIKECGHPCYVVFTSEDCENCDLCDKSKSNVTFIVDDDENIVGFRHEYDDGEVKSCLCVETENEELLREYMEELGIECDA